MKPVGTSLIEEDRIDGEVVNFSISTANSAWIMRSMADLYSNRELACIREYSTNAYDSNKEAALASGTDVAPIEVTLPSVLNPYFEVKDSGVGMSARELREVYTMFGESTKRETDEMNGMLGFGSKSAVAYTNTFTITSVKDGLKNVGVITRREDAQGGYVVTLKMVMVDVPTAERNGVAVKIPVHNHVEFKAKAEDFYRFWLPGTVLVNGKRPDWSVGEKIDEGLYYSKSGISYVVMGNVPYRVTNSDALFPRGMNRISFVSYVPIGTVEFTPSREDLKYSEHTKRNLHAIIDDFVKRSKANAIKEIAAASNHAEAYKVWDKWRRVLGQSQVEDLKYKGESVVEIVKVPENGVRWNRRDYRYNTNNLNYYTVSDSLNTVFIVDCNVGISTGQKKKVNAWLKFKGLDPDYVFFTPATKINSVWILESSQFTWEQVKAEAPKQPRAPRPATVAWGRKAGSFDLITASGRKNEQDVPQVTPLYYISVREYNVSKGEHNNSLSAILKRFKMHNSVVLVPANRLDKFLRHYPQAQSIMPVLKSQVKLDGPSLISTDGKAYLSLSPHEAAALKDFKNAKVADPFVKEWIRIACLEEVEILQEYDRHQALAKALGMRGKFKEHGFDYWSRKKMPVTNKYPLLDRRYVAHSIVYMDAVYKAAEKGK